MPSLSSAAHAIRPGVFAELQKRIDARGGDLIPLQIGDTAVDPPREARFVSDDDPGLYRYGATAALAPLRVQIAAWLRAVRGLEIHPEHELLVGVGGTHAIFCALRTILDPGDDVLLAAPYWPLAPGIIAACSGKTIEVPLTDRLYENPELDAGALFAAALTERTRAIYVITPNNPDGKILEKKHLEQIAELATRRDLWILADEVYADHAFDAPHVSIANLARERTITAYSLSKSHAMAGARIGYIAAPAALIAAARRVSTHTVFNVPVIAQNAALSALRAGPRWVEEARDRYRDARDIAVSALRDLPIDFHVAEGSTYLFINFARALGGRPIRELLESAIDHGVLLAPGEAFGAAYTTHARLCYSGVPPERLRDGLARLRDTITSFSRG